MKAIINLVAVFSLIFLASFNSNAATVNASSLSPNSDYTLAAGNVLNMDVNLTLSSLTTSGRNTATISGVNTLTITGGITFGDPGGNNTITLLVSSRLIFNGSLTQGGTPTTGKKRTAVFTVASGGTLVLTEGFTLVTTGTQWNTFSTIVYNAGSALEYSLSSDATTSTIEFPNTGVRDLTINNNPGIKTTLNANKTLQAGNLTISSGDFDLSTFTSNRSASGGVLSISNGAMLIIGGTNTALPANFATHSIGAASTIEYDGTNQTVSALNSGQTYGNLIITGSGSTKSVAAATTVANLLTINSGAVLNMANTNLTVGGLTGSGNLTHTSGTAGIRTISIGAANTSPAAFSGVISNGTATSVVLTKTGTGTLSLSGTNTYTGVTNVNAGVLNIQNNQGTGTSAGGVIVASGAVLELQGGITVGAETITLNNTGISSGGSLRNISGDNTWGGTITLSTNAVRINSDAGTLTLNAVNSITASDVNLTIGGAGDITISGTITTGSATVTKDGNGIATLSGTNTFTGGTRLEEGTLNINNGQALGSAASTFTIAGGIIDNTTAGLITTVNHPIALNADFLFTGTQPLNLGTGAVTMNGSRQITVAAATLTMGGTINNSAFSLTKAGAGTLSFGSQTITLNNLTNIDGSLTSTSGTLNIAGNFSNSGTFAHNSGTVNYNNASGGQSVAGVTYRNLTLSHTSGTSTATGDVTVGGTFIFSGSGATFDMDSYALSVAGSFSSSGTVRTQNTSAAPLPAGMSWGGSVEYYNTSGGQTVVSGNYTNLSLSNSSGTNTASGAVTVNGQLTVASGGTFNMSSYALSGSSFTTSGTGTIKTQHIATASPLPANASWTTTVEYAGAGISQTVVAGTYSSLVMAGASGPSMSGNVTVQSGLTLTSGILATGANTLTIQTNNISTAGGGSIDGTDGTVIFDYNGTINLPSANPFFGGNPVTNLTITGGAVLNLGSDETVEGVLSITSGKLGLADGKTLVLNGTIANMSAGNSIVGISTATIELRGGADQMGTIYFDQTTPGSSNTINNFAVNRDALADSIVIGNKMRVRGVLTPNKGTVSSNGNLAIGSDSTGSGRIYPEVIAANFQFVGDVSIERYAKDKNMRRYLFISSPVDGVTIRNAWQDDIFITGVGTGGTPCGAGTGNGGANDRYNSNGFDATIANLVTVYTYDQNNSARWVAVPNTSTTLQKGKGYRVLYRGERGVNDANCSGYLTLNNPPSPSSATMNVAGAPTSGSFSVTVDGKTTGNYGYTLLGNPYACELNFSLFRAQNSTQIAPTYWTYDPNGQTNSTGYLTVNNGTAAGYYHSDPSGNPANYPNPDVIASGQAFFVQSVNTGTVTFSESQKVNQSQAGVFKTTNQWDSRIRIHFRQADGTPIDNAVIRFTDDSTVTVQENSTWDAATMNGGNFVATIKGTRSFAIQTRPLNFFNDTVMVRIVSAAAGNFRLDFTDFDNFDEAAQIILLDLFTGTTADVKQNTVYPFTVTSNTASQGGRFKLVFRSLRSVLPLTFLNVSAVNVSAGVQVKWKLAFEQGVQQYLVERSHNGQQFLVIGTVGSNGNSSAPVEYGFLDTYPLTGTSWYRIRSVEQGEGKYSPTVQVNSVSKQGGITIYPNPVKNRIQIITPMVENFSRCDVYIRSSEGRVVLQFRDIDLKTSQQDVSALPAGVYFISVISRTGETLQSRFLKQ